MKSSTSVLIILCAGIFFFLFYFSDRYHEVIVKNEFNKILFRCSECDYTSTSTRGLKAHIRNRHKQKSEDDGPPYECQTCGKMYRHKKSLIQHMRFECGVEPQFECYICNCRYRQKHDLKRHIKQRHFK